MPSALAVVRKFFPWVTVVKDAQECIQIEVTKADDKKATLKDHKTCAMAVACKREFGCDGVIVSVKTAYLVKGKIATRYNLPESVSREVVSFDRDGGFMPGRYQLSKVPPSLKLGPKPKTGHKARGGRDKDFIHQTAGIRVVLSRKEE